MIKARNTRKFVHPGPLSEEVVGTAFLPLTQPFGLFIGATCWVRPPGPKLGSCPHTSQTADRVN